MIARALLAAGLWFGSVCSSPLVAQDVAEEPAVSVFEPVIGDGAITLDPDAAYLMVQAFDSVVTVFIRESSEPDEFDGPDIDPASTLFVIPEERLSGTRGSTIWLYRIPPGTYAYYGRAYMVGGRPGPIDCACMGSVKFAVESGQVTAVKVAVQELDENGGAVEWSQRSRNPIDGEIRRGPSVGPVSEAAIDPRVERSSIVDAQFLPVAALDNWAGGTINRVLPIENVLGYERGEAVDLRPSAAAN